uniref:Uncharacterized protein n=1 Tax=viral metagenome TaxID=1070528 RepID=A0A6C0F8U1_9ZZZZ|tara:strand:+ start:5100 stop:5402 length:303 start_codon:yes stop_codon:yes gene_type:complete
MSYYTTINGIKMDKKLLEQGQHLELNNPQLNFHIKILLETSMDANKLTYIELNTLQYINDSVLQDSDTILKTVLKMIRMTTEKPNIITEAPKEAWDYNRP